MVRDTRRQPEPSVRGARAALPRVLSYPPRHPYVDRLDAVAGRLVHRDVVWPRLPPYYDPAWLRTHRDEWDLVHLHFTFEQYPVRRLCAVLDTHRANGHPIIWTAHDLRVPHTRDARSDRATLDVLAARADQVITLTPGAAGHLRTEVGREAQVVPHGPLVPMLRAHELRAAHRRSERPERPGRHGRHGRHGRRGEAPPRVLVHARGLRTNLDLHGPVRAIRAAHRRGCPTRLVLSLHDVPPVRALLRDLQLSPTDEHPVEVRVHRPWDDDELATAIAEVDAVLLPYRWGTHSGLAELATDVGTAVLAAAVGHIHEQVPVRRIGAGEASLRAAFDDVAAGRLPPPVPLVARRRGLEEYLDTHRRLYQDALTGRRARASSAGRG